MADKHVRNDSFTTISISLNQTISQLQVGVQISSGNSAGGVLPSPTSASSLDPDASCHVWQDAQHTLFQLANLCAAVSLLTPGSFRHHLLFLRCLLLVAYLLFVLWAGLFVCMLDVLVWNCIFFFIDFAHVVCLTYSNIPSRFSPSLNELYTKKLKPLKVCRKDFANLCNLGNIVPLRKGSRYSIENQTQCGEKVSINLRGRNVLRSKDDWYDVDHIVHRMPMRGWQHLADELQDVKWLYILPTDTCGRLKVTHDGMFLHMIEPNEFLDSPEFDSASFQSSDSNQKYQVTITAAEECLIVCWMYPTIKAFLAANPFLSTVFANIIGKDISDKLYKIQELLQSTKSECKSSFTIHSSSLTDVCKCQSPQSGQRQGFANAQDSLSESAVSLFSHHMASVTIETGV